MSKLITFKRIYTTPRDYAKRVLKNQYTFNGDPLLVTKAEPEHWENMLRSQGRRSFTSETLVGHVRDFKLKIRNIPIGRCVVELTITVDTTHGSITESELQDFVITPVCMTKKSLRKSGTSHLEGGIFGFNFTHKDLVAPEFKDINRLNK